jgi:glutamate synthase (NADPH) large chain
LAASAAALPEALPYALEHGFDLFVLDGSPGLGSLRSELAGPPDLTVVRDAIRLLRELDQEERIDLLYFGGLRTGTDVAKVLAFNCRAGVLGVAMALALGAELVAGEVVFGNDQAPAERAAAGANWLKSAAEETAIIARCVGKTNIHNLEPEDMRSITLATADALGIPLASGKSVYYRA